MATELTRVDVLLANLETACADAVALRLCDFACVVSC